MPTRLSMARKSIRQIYRLIAFHFRKFRISCKINWIWEKRQTLSLLLQPFEYGASFASFDNHLYEFAAMPTKVTFPFWLRRQLNQPPLLSFTHSRRLHDLRLHTYIVVSFVVHRIRYVECLLRRFVTETNANSHHKTASIISTDDREKKREVFTHTQTYAQNRNHRNHSIARWSNYFFRRFPFWLALTSVFLFVSETCKQWTSERKKSRRKSK